MKLGARILKTGIAIVLALAIARALHLPSPVFAGIQAVFAIQPTIYRSYKTIVEQVQGNVIGAAIAILTVICFGNHIVFVGLASIIAILIILKLKLDNTVGLALVTIIAIMEVQNEQFIQFALLRFGTIMLGILAAFVVNLIFIPPKYETKLFLHMNNVTEDILKWIRLSTRNASDYQLLKLDISKISERLSKTDELYKLYKEDRNTFKISHTAKNRRLVIYRQMIITVRKSFEILKRLHHYENEIQQLPEELQKRIQDMLDALISYHEQILLKFVGKAKKKTELEEVHDVYLNRKEFMDAFLDEIIEEYSGSKDTQSFHLLYIVTSILEYGEQVEHLDMLIHSFQNFHKSENEVKIKEEEV
jgi:uncharacterized membrane protein YgaE (UPF0421/DUF939 family)